MNTRIVDADAGRHTVRLDDLRWHRTEITLACLEPPRKTSRGHALEVVSALLHGVARSSGQRIAYHSPDVPLIRQPLRDGTRIGLRLALIGYNMEDARGWIARFLEHVNGRRESHFRVLDAGVPAETGLRNLRMPAPSDEWRLDFDTHLPFTRNKDDDRTALRSTTLWSTIHRRLEKLFGATIPASIDPDCIDVVSCYWHYDEHKHWSKSENEEQGRNGASSRTKAGNPKAAAKARTTHDHAESDGADGGNWQYFNGCVGPIFLRGELESLAPWLAVAEALHAGGPLELNPLGHFRLVDRADAFLDRELGNVPALARVAELVLGHSDAAVAHARSHEGPVDPVAVARDLAMELAGDRYQPAPYVAAEIPKDTGGTRMIERLAPCDTIAQQYLHEILAKPFDNTFSRSSMAFRRGISREEAARRVRALIASGNRFAARTDVEAFFPSVDHARLLAALDRLLPRGDKIIRSTLARIIKAPVIRGIDESPRPVGLAQGSPLSPLLANLFLDTFDQRLDEAGIVFVRYADDIVLLARSRDAARAALEETRGTLAALGLRANEDKTIPAVAAAEGFEFLGEHFDETDIEPQVRVLLPQRRPLIIAEPYLTLAVNGDAIDIRRAGQLIDTIPMRLVSQVVLLNRASFSTVLIERCTYHGIPLSVGIHTTHRIATFAADTRSFREVAWRQGQRYHSLSTGERTAIASDFACAKILSYLPFILDRYHKNDAKIVHELKDNAALVRGAGTNDSIRGHEGAAAHRIFQLINREIAPDKKRSFCSPRRDTKGIDRLNSMLNFGYHLLAIRIGGLVRSFGLNPFLGYLHESRENYETLVYDLIEPFRVHVDRLALRLINRGQIRADDFDKVAERLRMSRGAIKTYAEEFEKVMAEVHGSITINDAIVLQVENLRDFAADGKPLRVYRWARERHEAPVPPDYGCASR